MKKFTLLIAVIAVGVTIVALATAYNQNLQNTEQNNNPSISIDIKSPIISTIPIGGDIRDLTIDPTTNVLYAPNMGGYVSVINASSGRTISTVTQDYNPWGIAVDSSLKKVYIATAGSPSLYIMNASTNKIDDNIFLGTGENPREMLVDQDTHILTVHSPLSGKIIQIDGKTNTVLPRESNPNQLALVPGKALNRNTGLIYAANSDLKSISVIDGKKGNAIDEITVDNVPISIAVNPNTNRVFVANSFSDSLTVIDGLTNKVVLAIPIGFLVNAVTVNPESNKVYATSVNSLALPYPASVSVIDDNLITSFLENRGKLLADSRLIITATDKSGKHELHDVRTIILQNGKIVQAKNSTPAVYNLHSGQSYQVALIDPNNYLFSSWIDRPESPLQSRTILVPLSSNHTTMNLTAIFKPGNQSISPSPVNLKEGQKDGVLTVLKIHPDRVEVSAYAGPIFGGTGHRTIGIGESAASGCGSFVTLIGISEGSATFLEGKNACINAVCWLQKALLHEDNIEDQVFFN